MISGFFKPHRIYTLLIIPILIQGCLRLGRVSPPALPTAQDIQTISPALQDQATLTPVVASPTPAESTPTDRLLAQTALPKLTITAVKGNIFIRRGPGMAYNPIGVLYKNSSTRVIARDVLSKWVQVIIPDSEKTGWVSIQTEFSKLDGRVESVPDLVTIDWPIPAYLRNCTLHDMYVMPGEITLPSIYGYPDNEVWLYPGFYTVQDLFVPGEPQVLDFEMREGMQIDIRTDGLGERRKCP